MLETQKWYIVTCVLNCYIFWFDEKIGMEMKLLLIEFLQRNYWPGLVGWLMLTYINSYWYNNCFPLPEFPISDTPQMPLQIQPIRKQDTIRSWSRPIATTTRHDEYFCLEVMSSVLAQQRTEKPEIMVPVNYTSNKDCKM